MEDSRNDRNVEKRLRDCVKNDRARVQIGKISQFGLLEMSRQRLRAGVVAGSTVPCPTCAGQGIVRSVESTALRVLRSLDEEGQRQRANTLVVHAPVEVAMYTLNQKRREIARMEQDYAITIAFQPKDDMQAGTFDMERIGQRAPEDRAKIAATADTPRSTKKFPKAKSRRPKPHSLTRSSSRTAKAGAAGAVAAVAEAATEISPRLASPIRRRRTSKRPKCRMKPKAMTKKTITPKAASTPNITSRSTVQRRTAKVADANAVAVAAEAAVAVSATAAIRTMSVRATALKAFRSMRACRTATPPTRP